MPGVEAGAQGRHIGSSAKRLLNLEELLSAVLAECFHLFHRAVRVASATTT